MIDNQMTPDERERLNQEIAEYRSDLLTATIAEHNIHASIIGMGNCVSRLQAVITPLESALTETRAYVALLNARIARLSKLV